ncbi:type VII secretion-associated protein [Mycobacteriaceae bacterium 1482268.1]|nr:type VII secretion-associated protein [Mycobacteriaceae bacterium 1482268.1]
MSACVVEVGPGAVRGPGCVATDLASTALDCIDDEIALLDEQPVAVDAIWREVFRCALPERADVTVLVCPTWWPAPWIERVEAAASSRSAKVTVLQRADVVPRQQSGVPTIVEIATDLVAVSRDGSVVNVDPRLGSTADVASAVVDSIGAAVTVLVHAPVGVTGADGLAEAVSKCLRVKGIAVTPVSLDWELASTCDRRTRETFGPPSGRRGGRSVVLAALATSVTMLCAGVGLVSETDESAATAMPMTVLVEGRVALKVPALWTVRRVTTGPGSARVVVRTPDESAAVLVTQSQVPGGEPLAATAAALQTALDDQQPGVFGDFIADGRRADRAAVTYRETRQNRQIEWAVFVDDAVRIGIGCQSAPGGEHLVRDACDEAIRSAHAVV